MIETLNHFEDENSTNTIFLFEVNRKPYFHDIMMELLIDSVKLCIKNNTLLEYDSYIHDSDDDIKFILQEAFNYEYGYLNAFNIKTKMNNDDFFKTATKEFEELFEKLSGLDMIKLIQELNCYEEIDLTYFDSHCCFNRLCDIYVEEFVNYHEQTKEQYIDCKIDTCIRFLDETCLMSFHNPHTEIGKKHVENLYKELQELE